MIDFENIPLIKMFTEKARLEEREKALEELREAEAKAYADALLRVIDQEFGKRGVEELEPQIRAIEDGQKLASLIAPAVRSHSIDEFKRILEQNGLGKN